MLVRTFTLAASLSLSLIRQFHHRMSFYSCCEQKTGKNTFNKGAESEITSQRENESTKAVFNNLASFIHVINSYNLE